MSISITVASAAMETSKYEMPKPKAHSHTKVLVRHTPASVYILPDWERWVAAVSQSKHGAPIPAKAAKTSSGGKTSTHCPKPTVAPSLQG